MKHRAAPEFWEAFQALDPVVQQAARNAFRLLNDDPRHPSLHLKKAGRFWSARVGLNYRAVAVDAEDGLVWIWIGPHGPYERMLS